MGSRCLVVFAGHLLPGGTCCGYHWENSLNERDVSMRPLALQGEWTDASSAAEAAQHYYMQAKMAAESAQRYASSGPASSGADPQGTNLPMPPANMGAPAPGTGIPPEFLLPNASRPPSGRTPGPVLHLHLTQLCVLNQFYSVRYQAVV